MDMDKLGFKAKDKVTGFEGTITAITRYLFASSRYCLEPEAKDGEFGEPQWIDEERIEVVGSQPFVVRA